MTIDLPDDLERSISQAPDLLLGAMRDAADEMDEITDEAMMQREQQPFTPRE